MKAIKIHTTNKIEVFDTDLPGFGVEIARASEEYEYQVRIQSFLVPRRAGECDYPIGTISSVITWAGELCRKLNFSNKRGEADENLSAL